AIKISRGQELAAKSPMLMRFLKRGMVEGFETWKGAYLENRRNRQILERMAFRMKYACVVQAFHDWDTFVDIRVSERFDQVKSAVSTSLRQ
ncbi:hypothetical protein T484DRAFT_1806633, partial [Baffinella frigidus]